MKSEIQNNIESEINQHQKIIKITTTSKPKSLQHQQIHINYQTSDLSSF